jgi:hypothetical protein
MSFWLIFYGSGFWQSVSYLLQGTAIAVILWIFLGEDVKGSRLLELLPRHFVVSVISASIIWLVILGGAAFRTFSFLELWFLMFWPLFWVAVIPLSLLSVAIFVLVYGIFRRKIEAWQFLLSAWFTSFFAVNAVFDVWWWMFIFPYLNGPGYNTGAGAIAGDILRVLAAFFCACILTFIYASLKEPPETPP